MVTKSRNRSNTTSLNKSSAKKSQTSTPAPATNGNGSRPSEEESLRKLYASLLRCRLLQEHARQSSDLTDKYDFASGQEAVIAGTTANLEAEDTVTASHRDLGVRIAREVPLKSGMTKRNGRESAGCMMADSLTRASLPQDPFNLGTGLALAHKLEKKRHVVVAFCAQETMSLDPWSEALKFAGTNKLPILYVIKNGSPGEPPAASHAPHLEAFSFMARDYGFPGIIVDGRDVVAVWRAAQESIHRARNGSGATLIDCRTDSSQDPLTYMEHYMKKRKVWDDSWKRKIAAQVKTEIDVAGRDAG